MNKSRTGGATSKALLQEFFCRVFPRETTIVARPAPSAARLFRLLCKAKPSVTEKREMTADSSASPAECATVWFARLERAKAQNDFEAAAEAVRQLRRLGVKVAFINKRKDSSNE